MRLAFLSPLNPERSGISDYSEELLPYLARHAEIELVTREYLPENPVIRGAFVTRTPQEFLARRDSYDSVIYQIGNHYGYHGHMASCLRQVPGVVVLHDYSLSYLMLGLTVAQGDVASLEQILEPGYGNEARALARKILLGLIDPYELSLARPVVDMSTGIIVHNSYAFARLQREYPDKLIGIVRHATPVRDPLGDAAALRKKYGLPADDFVIVSVSRLAYNKRLDLAVQVLHDVVREHPQTRLILVGEGHLSRQAEKLIRRYRLQDNVLRTGFVSAQAYLDYIDLADAAIDIRYPTAGETSGGSLRLLQSGKPIVASAQGFFVELPPECCFVIAVEAEEQSMIRDALLKLIRDPDLRRRMGQAARAYALRNLTREQAADGYVEFVGRVNAEGRRPTRQWDLPARSSTFTLPLRVVHQTARLIQFSSQYGAAAAARRVWQHFGGA
jgi:glycosyltransferase involved in cell wall biosynthesis